MLIFLSRPIEFVVSIICGFAEGILQNNETINFTHVLILHVYLFEIQISDGRYVVVRMHYTFILVSKMIKNPCKDVHLVSVAR